MTMNRVETVFHALSDPGRIEILRHLRSGEHRVRDLTEHLHLAQSTVSAHLACLRDCGLVTSRPHGRASLYSLVAEDEVVAVLEAATALAAATGGGGSHVHTGEDSADHEVTR